MTNDLPFGFDREDHLIFDDSFGSLPIISPSERADLEREAGRAFASNEEAHRYRIQRLNVVTSTPELAERLERERTK